MKQQYELLSDRNFDIIYIAIIHHPRAVRREDQQKYWTEIKILNLKFRYWEVKQLLSFYELLLLFGREQ